MAEDAFSSFDPAQTLGPDDPLREWAANNMDFRTGRLLQQDPAAAIDSMIKRGIPPPDVHADGSSALGYAGEVGDTSQTGMGGAPDDVRAPVRTLPNGKIAGNITAPVINPPAPVLPAVPVSVPASATPVKADDGDSDTDEKKRLSAQDAKDDAEEDAKDALKKNDAGDALAGFSKSLAGIKAPTAPPLNAVGTPSVRSPGSISAPNVNNLISLLSSGAVPQSVAPALGRLLVQGKA